MPAPALDSHHDLLKLVRSAFAELNNIPASRTVFQRNGNLFFHTPAQKATSYKQTKNRKLMAFMIFAIFMVTINGVLSKSRRPISEMEIWEKKNKCYADIESGLWGEKCKTSMVAKENCALQCLSPVCYELIYESDPGLSWREFGRHQRFLQLLVSYASLLLTQRVRAAEMIARLGYAD
nr:uncharacterized protein LOC109163941 isoform X3 [Ipomoea trifida]